jgi:hypothetical protein
LLTRAPEASAGSIALFALGVLLLAFVALLCYLIWTAIA